jgi:hypothetical protein
MQGMFQTDVKPMFDTLAAELQAIQGTDSHLDANIAQLDAHLVALDAHVRGLTAQMAKINAHPLVASKPAVKK